MREFLEKVPVVSLSESHRKELNNPVTEEEVRLAINSLKGGKAPGPDGFCPEFYKTLIHLLAGPLTDMFLDAFKNEKLPSTLRQANILLILKKNKSPDRCESYRHTASSMSMLNYPLSY
uniref:Reverse transcriptase domain-containing protein n=1 Tax=Pundamilia nyererei TaxID=303518 RepID=A0A3B4GKJ1_9CICH